ncbi:uncharacterized protein LTHEOB_3328 [Neofusicoccum parvum]|uniref:Uncharacterized protein LTHEOB_3328 n=1 Tax=Neofusicoccum parvum TaxID=310453 RepID=A0ACB5S017_9PEZI|nr:uncharacterized protein LTHEOB_3328 [Neofusicoccum parvum]
MSSSAGDSRPAPSACGPLQLQQAQQQLKRQSHKRRHREPRRQQPSPSQSPSPSACGYESDASADSAAETAATERATKAHLAALLRGYCTYASAYTWRPWGDLFAEDAVLSFDYLGELRGRKEIVAGALGMQDGWYNSTFFSDVKLELDPHCPDDKATGSAKLWSGNTTEATKVPDTVLRSMTMAVDMREEKELSQSDCEYCGPYHFEFVKTEEGWKIKSMALKVLGENREEVDRLCTRCDCIPLSSCGTPCR